MKSKVFCLTGLLQLLVSMTWAQPTLKVGDLPPKFDPDVWLRGEPVKEFAPDRIYVVEFGGIECSPCRASQPYLSALAVKYKEKATVNSVFIFDDDETSEVYAEQVRRYIDNQGSKIKYQVAVDKRTLFHEWMEASDHMGIPVAFVISGGKISWIGNPLYLEPVLEKFINNDANIEIESQREIDYYARITTIDSLITDYKFSEAYAIIDSLIETTTDIFLYKKRFDLLLKINETAAYKYGNNVLDGALRDQEPVLFEMARALASYFYEGGAIHADTTIAMRLTRRAIQLSSSVEIQIQMMEVQIEVLAWGAHDFDAAIKKMKEMLAIMEKSGLATDPVRKRVAANTEFFSKQTQQQKIQNTKFYKK